VLTAFVPGFKSPSDILRARIERGANGHFIPLLCLYIILAELGNALCLIVDHFEKELSRARRPAEPLQGTYQDALHLRRKRSNSGPLLSGFDFAGEINNPIVGLSSHNG
jgi:hypothetical protein